MLLGHGATCRSDMYSFACSIFAVFFGAPPFFSLHPSAQLWRFCTATGVPPFEFELEEKEKKKESGEKKKMVPSPALLSLMHSAFQIDPQMRISAQNVLKSPFWQLDGVGVEELVKHTVDSAFLDSALDDFGL